MEELTPVELCSLPTTHWFFVFQPASCNNVTIPDLMVKMPYVVLMTTIASMITVGIIISNALFIWTLARMKRSSTSTKTVYFSLATANLLLGHVCLIFIPSVAVHSHWPYAGWLCQTTAYLATSFSLITAFSMAGLSVKRCIIICRPLDFHRFVGQRASTIAMAMIWIVSFALTAIWGFAAHPMSLFAYKPASFICGLDYGRDIDTDIVSLLLIVGVSGGLIVGSWLVILYQARRHFNRFSIRRKRIVASRRTTSESMMSRSVSGSVSAPSTPTSKEPPESELSRKMSVNPRADPIWKQIRIVLAVTGSFMIAWLPFHIRQIVLAFSNNYNEKPWPDFVLTWLVISNSFWSALFCMLTDMDCRNTLKINFILCKATILTKTNSFSGLLLRRNQSMPTMDAKAVNSVS